MLHSKKAEELFVFIKILPKYIKYDTKCIHLYNKGERRTFWQTKISLWQKAESTCISTGWPNRVTCTPSKLKWTPTMLLLSTCTTYNTHLVHQRNSHHPLTIKSSFFGGQYKRKMIETQVLTKHCISGLPLTSKEWPWTSYFTAFIHVVYRQIDHCILKRIWSSEQGEYFHYFHVHDFRVSKKKCRLKIMVLQIPP